MNKNAKILLKKIKLIKLRPLKKTKITELKLIKKRISHNKKEPKNLMSILEKQKFNDLSHLFRNSHNSDIDVKWTLSLRNSENDSSSKEYERRMIKINSMKPPSFFSRDYDNYIKKKSEREKSSDDIILPNLVQYKGLFEKRLADTHGTILNNKNLLNFELNLRKISNNNRKNIRKAIFSSFMYDKNPKWDNSVLTIKKDDLKIMNNSMDSHRFSKYGKLDEQYIYRPYKILFNKVKFDDKNYIYKKEYIKDKFKAFATLGDVYSYGPYNDNYKIKNYNEIIDAMKPKERTQQNLNYNMNLRIYKTKNL